MQGRYLFGGLVAVFAAIAIGVGSLGREGGRLQRWLPTIALPLVLLVAAYGLLVAFDGFYIDVGLDAVGRVAADGRLVRRPELGRARRGRRPGGAARSSPSG